MLADAVLHLYYRLFIERQLVKSEISSTDIAAEAWIHRASKYRFAFGGDEIASWVMIIYSRK